MNFKKILALLLCFAMVLGTMSIPAFATEAGVPSAEAKIGYFTSNFNNTERDGIYGEAYNIAGTESFKIELYSGDILVGTTELVDPENVLLNGVSKTISWHILIGEDNDSWWKTSWVDGAMNVNKLPDKLKLYVDEEKVSEGNVVLNSADNSYPIIALVTNVNGDVQSFVTANGYVNNMKDVDAKLNDAIADSDYVSIVRAGTYAVPTGKNCTITGAVDGVVFDNIGKCGMFSSVTFNNVTFDYYPNVNYTGLQHSGDMVYNNCTFNGQVFLYGESETFNNCTFNQNSSDAYNVWTYSAKEVAFNKCTFNSAGKSVLIYAEGAEIFNDVTVTDCDFIASTVVKDKAAIEMDSSATAGIKLTIDSETTATGFDKGNISGNNLWNNKKGSTGVNNDIVVLVNGETVLAPTPVEVKTYEELVAALEGDNYNIKMMNNITGIATESNAYGKSGINIKNGHTLDGNGFTLSLSGLGGTWDSAISTTGGTIKNLTIDEGFRGIFINHDSTYSDTVVLENVIIDGPVYTVHCDQGENKGLIANNCTFNGWTSYAATIGSAEFNNCKFGEGSGYAFLRPYLSTEFNGCDFEAGFKFDTAKVAANSFEFNNCKYDGESLGEESWKMFYNGGSVVINGEQISFMNHANIVAHIGNKNYDSVASALADAEDGAKIELDWNEGDAPIAMNGAVFGKSVTITGTAAVDWSKGFLFIGRGGEGNGTVIFDNANLTSASNQASTGIHVSGREKDTTNKYDGTLVINNSTIELDYLINKSTMTLDNSTLTVKNGFSVGGRPASETENGEDATATLTLNNNSKLIVNNHNGMGLGYEAVGVMNVNAGSTFQCTQDFLITEKGTMNIDGGNVNIEGKLDVKGTLKSSGNIFGEITKADDAVIEITGGTYTQDVSAYLADGYAAIANLDGNYIVGQAPTATVTNLGATTIKGGDYNVYPSGSNTEDMDLSFVMQFLADQNEEDMKTSPYAEWYGDFVITFTGIENNSFTADGCYLAGYYGDFGWIQVPVDGMTIENGARYPVMLGFGAGQKYDYICESVKDFRCAMYLTPEILKANPNLKVNLELSVVDNSQGSDAAKKALIEGKEGTFYKSTSIEYVANDFEEEIKPLHRILLISNMELRENNGVLYYPVHVYAGIDSLNYKEVGFMFNVKNTENPQGEERTYKTKTVYTGMNVKQSDGTVEKVLASELGGKYMFGHNMNFKTTSYSNADTEIEITPYAIKLDGTTITGDPISITDAKIKAKYPNSALFKEETTTEEEN